MDAELAIRILDKETTSAALRKIQQMNKKCEIDESMNDLLRECGFEE